MIHYITTNGLGNPTVGKELRFVREAGIPFRLTTMRKPESVLFSSDWAQRLHEETISLYPVPIGRLIANALAAPFIFRGRFLSSLFNACFGDRESFRQRIAALYHLFVACMWAARLKRDGGEVSRIHSQWIHSAGTIGMYAAWLLGVPFSFMGHATDLFRDRVALKDKIRRADFIACISTFHRDLYQEIGDATNDKLDIVYCGIDVELFEYRAKAATNNGRPFRIVSAGRLVDKKGFEYLIDACALLKTRGRSIECEIIGGGPLFDSLRRRADDRGVGGDLIMTGEPFRQEDIPAFMHGGDLFCLPCVWAADNDVDGLPQVLMEAMACGTPVCSTRLVGIPDLVIHEETGLLVAPNQVEELADAIESLMDDPQKRVTLAAAARTHVERCFNAETCLIPLIQRFRASLSGEHHGDGSDEGAPMNGASDHQSHSARTTADVA